MESTEAPRIFLAEMDWSVLVYIALAVGYAVVQFLRSKGNEEGGNASERKVSGDPAAEERMRRIQEEIRRKIAERRAGSGPSSVETAPGPRPQEPPPRYDPFAPERSRQERSAPSQPAPVNRPEPVVEPVREPLVSVPAPSEPSVEERLREQRRQLAKAKREREAAYGRALEIERKAGYSRRDNWGASGSEAVQTEGTVRDQVIAALKNPESARSAFVLLEVLGPPVSSKQEDRF